MKIETYTVTMEDFGEIATTGAKTMLTKLFDDGKITAETFEEYDLNYAIIAKPPTFFSKMWAKLRKGEDKPMYIMVKQVSLRPDEDVPKTEGEA